MMEITKEQVQEYIHKNFDTFFVSGLAQYVKDTMCVGANEEDMKELRSEIKQLIFESISNGVKEYLQEYDGEAVKIISKQFLEELAYKKISITFN